MRFAIIILFFIADTLLIGCWVHSMHPDLSISIGLILIIPFLIFINVAFGLTGFLIKKYVFKNLNKLLPPLFIINAVVSPILLVAFFQYEVKKGIDDLMTSLRFATGSKNYHLYLDLEKGKLKDRQRFELNEFEDHSETGVLLGIYYNQRTPFFL